MWVIGNWYEVVGNKPTLGEKRILKWELMKETKYVNKEPRMDALLDRCITSRMNKGLRLVECKGNPQRKGCMMSWYAQNNWICW